jgi:hypothetical protein
MLSTVVATNDMCPLFRIRNLCVAFTANTALAHYLSGMDWAIWLSVPITATTLAAIGTWWQGRRARAAANLDTAASMRAHAEYLEALTIPARSSHRPVRPSAEHIQAS